MIGCAGSLAGLYVSYAYDLAAGGSVVVVLTGVFVVTWCLAPRHGLLERTAKKTVAGPVGPVSPGGGGRAVRAGTS